MTSVPAKTHHSVDAWNSIRLPPATL